MKKRAIFRMLFIVVSTIIISSEVFAADIIRAVSGQDAVRLYLKGAVGMVTSANFQIGDQSIQELHPKFITEDTTPIRTLLLIDNSLSIPQNKRSEVKEILKDLVQGHSQNEQIRLSTFSETINYLSDYTVDYSSLERGIDSIEFINQETYLIDVLYDVLNDTIFNSYDGFQRIVIISNGADNKRITREELYDTLRADPYPVYTIGIESQRKNDNLENMFALSRITNVNSYILGNDDVSRIIGGISSDYSILVFTATIPDNMKNGGVTNSRLILSDGTEIEKTIRLPFANNSNTPSSNVVSQTNEDSADSSLSNGENSEDEEEDNEETELDTETVEENDDGEEEQSFFSKYWIFIIAGGIILIVLVVLVSIIVHLKRKNTGNDPIPNTIPNTIPNNIKPKDSLYLRQNIGNQSHNDPFQEYFESKDTLYFDQNIGKGEDSSTVAVNNELGGDNGNHRARFALIVIDVNDASKAFRKEIINHIVIGRSANSDIQISYDESVSRQQCRVIEQGDRFYVENLAKTNPTRLNGKIINTPEEIYSGDLLNMGNVNVRVNFENI